MRTTRLSESWLDPLRVRWIFVFLCVCVLWALVAQFDDWNAFLPRAAARLAGYVAFLAMLVPYLHIVRRSFRYRTGPLMRTWLRLHIGAAYLAFLMVLIHSRARASSPLTSAIVWLVWVVMLSGVIGYYGQKLLYFLLPRIVGREHGLERLEPQRLALVQTSEELTKKKEMQQAAEVVLKFCEAAKRDCLAVEFSFRGWFRAIPQERIVSENWYHRALSFATTEQSESVTNLWQLVQMKRKMDLEYRLHQLGRLWLLVHGPAAWALFVLMVEHVAMSMWYGGF